MITIELVNMNTNRTFEKTFDNVKEARKFLIRCRYSLVLKVMGISSDSRQAVEELNHYL